MNTRYRILKYLIECRTNGKIMPTYREIMKDCRLSTTSLVRYYLKQLEQQGYIDRAPNLARAIIIKSAGYEWFDRTERK